MPSAGSKCGRGVRAAEEVRGQGPCSVASRGPRGAATSRSKPSATDLRVERGLGGARSGRGRTTTRATDGGGIMHGFESIGAITAGALTANKVLRLGLDKRFRKETVKWPKLLASVAIDAVGVSSYALPGIGEGEDILWAPVSATLVQVLYGAYWLSALDLLEEGLPFSDFIPTACLAWAIEYTSIRRVLPFLPKPKGGDDGDGEKKKA